MTEKELKRLNRRQLLELLIIQTERADDLQAQLTAAQEQLQAKTVALSKPGSIAEASMQLSGIFEVAQQTAEIYLENIRQLEARLQAQVAMTTDTETAGHLQTDCGKEPDTL